MSFKRRSKEWRPWHGVVTMVGFAGVVIAGCVIFSYILYMLLAIAGGR